jgi:hypothetical protein
MEKRKAYFHLGGLCGEPIRICIATENTKGYYEMKLPFKGMLHQAESFCNEQNKNLGITEDEAQKIVLSTMTDTRFDDEYDSNKSSGW